VSYKKQELLTLYNQPSSLPDFGWNLCWLGGIYVGWVESMLVGWNLCWLGGIYAGWVESMLVIVLVFCVVFFCCCFIWFWSILDWTFGFSYFDVWSLADCLSCYLKCTSYRLKLLNTSCLFIHVEFQTSFPFKPIRVDSR
jgi:hypothetical protein